MDSNKILELRKITQLPIIICRNFLEKSNGNILKAKNLIMNKIKKIKIIKSINTNTIIIKKYKNISLILNISHKSDFLLNNINFKKLNNKIVYLIIKNIPKNIFKLKYLKLNYINLLKNINFLNAILKENIYIKNFSIIKYKNNIKNYIYKNIGIILNYKKNCKNLLAKNLCIHIIFKNPKFISLKSISIKSIINNYIILNKNFDNKDNKKNKKFLIEKSVINFFKNITLINQKFVRNPNFIIKDIIKNNKFFIKKYIIYN